MFSCASLHGGETCHCATEPNLPTSTQQQPTLGESTRSWKCRVRPPLVWDHKVLSVDSPNPESHLLQIILVDGDHLYFSEKALGYLPWSEMGFFVVFFSLMHVW
ncbi:hypothetical protein CHARACLAT_016942 [Characodon lateralis]|uniref:Uncharacterized protein n=1 Tax=Characodon lateralis TaxID=208331 RepID=A0ABU7EUH8_9TELE|nr:hypothetical protein [Characodon lateralis]